LQQARASGAAWPAARRQVYRSLSAVAKAVTDSHCNGYLFFRRALCNPRGRQGPCGELMDDRHSEGGATM